MMTLIKILSIHFSFVGCVDIGRNVHSKELVVLPGFFLSYNLYVGKKKFEHILGILIDRDVKS